MCTDKEMPKYQCNKQVWGLKIGKINYDDDATDMENSPAIITPENTDYSPFEVDAEYMNKHKPKVGGYYVLYKGGYRSFSPAKPFEDGYSLI